MDFSLSYDWSMYAPTTTAAQQSVHYPSFSASSDVSSSSAMIYPITNPPVIQSQQAPPVKKEIAKKPKRKQVKNACGKYFIILEEKSYIGMMSNHLII